MPFIEKSICSPRDLQYCLCLVANVCFYRSLLQSSFFCSVDVFLYQYHNVLKTKASHHIRFWYLIGQALVLLLWELWSCLQDVVHVYKLWIQLVKCTHVCVHTPCWKFDLYCIALSLWVNSGRINMFTRLWLSICKHSISLHYLSININWCKQYVCSLRPWIFQQLVIFSPISTHLTRVHITLNHVNVGRTN